MVGCWVCTYSSIHFFVSRSRSVARCAHIQAFTLKLQDQGRLSGVFCVCMWRVWCVWVVCVHVVLCVVLVVCVLLCCGGEAWHSLSLLFSLLPLLFPYLFLSYLSVSLFFFFFFFSCSFSYSCSCSQRRLLKTPLPPSLESVNKAANKVSTKSAFEDV